MGGCHGICDPDAGTVCAGIARHSGAACDPAAKSFLTPSVDAIGAKLLNSRGPAHNRAGPHSFWEILMSRLFTVILLLATLAVRAQDMNDAAAKLVASLSDDQK